MIFLVRRVGCCKKKLKIVKRLPISFIIRWSRSLNRSWQNKNRSRFRNTVIHTVNLCKTFMYLEGVCQLFKPTYQLVCPDFVVNLKSVYSL